MNKNNNSVGDYEAIMGTMKTYVEAFRTGDIELLRSVFHTDAIMHGYWDDFLVQGPITNLFASVERAGAAPNLTAQTSILDKTTTIATVRNEIEANATGDTFTEYHALLKADGQWKIVSKLFHKYDK